MTEDNNVRFYVCRLSYHVILYVVFLAASAYRHDPSCFILTSYPSNVWWCPGRSSVSNTSEFSACKRDWISAAVFCLRSSSVCVYSCANLLLPASFLSVPMIRSKKGEATAGLY